VVGVEPNRTAAEFAEREYGLIVHSDTWPGFFARVEGAYTVISALWVLEHLPNPMVFLEAARGLLVDHGKLLLAVPNEWTALQAEANRCVAKRFWWVCRDHINYWSWHTLEAMLVRCGFRICKRYATWPMERAITVGMDYTVDGQSGRLYHEAVERMDIRRTDKSRRDCYTTLAVNGEGRDIICVAEVAP
jgi:hypothetical protein